jgi:hypothetical protein
MKLEQLAFMSLEERLCRAEIPTFGDGTLPHLVLRSLRLEEKSQDSDF